VQMRFHLFFGLVAEQNGQERFENKRD